MYHEHGSVVLSPKVVTTTVTMFGDGANDEDDRSSLLAYRADGS